MGGAVEEGGAGGETSADLRGGVSAEQITPWVVPMKKVAQEEKRRPI